MILICPHCKGDELAPIRKGNAYYCLTCHHNIYPRLHEMPVKRAWRRRVPKESLEPKYKPLVPATILKEVTTLKKRIDFLESWAKRAGAV